jgi:diadenosine tetraphosphate (Ap4A) HIT family hydrolase
VLLHEDEQVFAFLDRAPAAAAHILVCPKAHVVSARHLHAHTLGDAELGAQSALRLLALRR